MSGQEVKWSEAMDYTRLLDGLPLWGFFLATVALVVLSIEGGYLLGRSRHALVNQEKEAPVAAIVAATLGLLAFMLAFTFSLAATRFDARRMVVLEEANAIGTSNLRAGLLPEPNRSEIQRLFRDYIDARLEAVHPNLTKQAVARSSEIHRALWAQATSVAAEDPHSIVTGIFIQSLNEVIDVHAKRAMLALHNRVPEMVWLVLYLITGLAMTALGYQEGLSGSRRSLAVLALAFTFSSVMWLIADLDRPQEGLLRIGQHAMIELRESLANPPAVTAPRP